VIGAAIVKSPGRRTPPIPVAPVMASS